MRGLLGHVVVVTGLWIQVLHGRIEALGIWIELGLEVLLQEVVRWIAKKLGLRPSDPFQGRIE